MIPVSLIKLSAIVLAAGKGSRFGAVKQLAMVEGITLLNKIVFQYQLSDVNSLCVVIGAHHDEIKSSLNKDVNTIYCEHWQMGMSESIKAGVAAVSEDNSHILIGLADQINIKAKHLNHLIRLANAHPDKIVATRYKSTLGAPAIFPRSYVTQLEKLSGDKGARSILHKYTNDLIIWDCEDLSVDIDYQQDLVDWQNIL